MSMMFSGLAEITKLTGLGLGGTKFDSIAIGTGSTAVAQNQTALVTVKSTDDADTKSVGTLLVRPATSGGVGSGGAYVAVFDAVDFATGFGSTIHQL